MSEPEIQIPIQRRMSGKYQYKDECQVLAIKI